MVHSSTSPAELPVTISEPFRLIASAPIVTPAALTGCALVVRQTGTDHERIRARVAASHSSIWSPTLTATRSTEPAKVARGNWPRTRTRCATGPVWDVELGDPGR